MMATMRTHLRLTAVGVLAAALTVGAGAAALSKKEFIKAADDICRQGDLLSEELVSETFPDPGSDPTQEQLDEYIAGIVPIIQQQHDAIEALPEPSADRKKIKKLLKTLQRELDVVEADPQAALESGAEPFAKSFKLAKGYGMKVCGE